jgi:hypothetical protein
VVTPVRLVRQGALRTGPDGEYPVKEGKLLKDEGGGSFVAKPAHEGEAAFCVVDFGRELVASPGLETEGGAGTTVELSYAEHDGPGAWTQAPGPFKGDRYTCRDGLQEWRTRELRGFRYMRLAFRGLVVPLWFRLTAGEGKARTAGVARFRCSDRTLNNIWMLCRRTLELCSLDTFVDSPGDQALVATDFRVEALAHYVTQTDDSLPRRGLRMLARTIGEDGCMDGTWPPLPEARGDENGLLWVMSLGDWLAWRGDEGLVDELHPALRLVMDWYAKRRGQDGLLRYPQARVHVEREGPQGDELVRECDGASSILNAFYAAALDSAAALAVAAGADAEAGAWSSRAAAVRGALSEALWRQSEGAFADCLRSDGELAGLSQQANLLVLRWGAPPEDKFAAALGSVRRQDDVRDPSWTRVGTPGFMEHYFAVLAARGMTEAALRILRERWGELLRNGATCARENWETGPGRSLCQGAGAHPLYFLATEVLGVKPTAPGAAKLRISPFTGFLRSAEGVVTTPKGQVEVSWKRGDGLAMEIRVPEGVEAVAELPLTGVRSPSLKRNGKTVWREGGAASEGVTVSKEKVAVALRPGKTESLEVR